MKESEYTFELSTKCKPIFIQGFRHLYNNIKAKNTKNRFLLREFQEELTNVPKWNKFIIEKEFKRFVTNLDVIGWIN